MVSLLLRGIRALKVVVRIVGLAGKWARPAIDRVRTYARTRAEGKAKEPDREKPLRPGGRQRNGSSKG